MHNGDDTAYYLHKGFRVIAIDANPAMVRQGERRFAESIAAGRLTILNMGIGVRRGSAQFFVSAERDVWSSLDKAIATRGGQAADAVTVECLTFSDLIREYGIPYYAKIDIEGGDRACIDSLTGDIAPPFISIEMAHDDGDIDIHTLRMLGYQRFRCIRQNDLVAMDEGNLATQIRLRRWRAASTPAAFLANVIRRLTKMARPPIDPTWSFRAGSSGSFAGHLPGEWLSFQQMLAVWQQLHDIDLELAAGGLSEWFDVHAAR